MMMMMMMMILEQLHELKFNWEGEISLQIDYSYSPCIHLCGRYQSFVERLLIYLYSYFSRVK